MDLNLVEHSVVVVGGASGIGRACVDSFLAEGARVAIWDRSPVSSVANSMVVDITDQVQVRQATADTENQLGPIDHVVHAAAIGSGRFGAPFTQLESGDWDAVLDVNIKGMVHVAHEISPLMVERKRGTFVFIASVAGQIGSTTDPPYSASKAANINFAQAMAKDLASSAIRVNTICPGMVRTPLNQSVWQAWNKRQSPASKMTYDEWADAKIRQLIPLGTWQKPEDIGNMAVFLSSDRAAQVTGQTINVDGGYVMHS